MWQALAIIGLFFIAVVGVEYVKIERLRTQNAQLTARLSSEASAAKAQADRAQATNAQHEAKTHEIQATLDATLAAHADTSAALADRMRQYSALERTCAVSKPASGPVSPVRHDGIGPVAGGPRPIDDALVALVRDTQPVIDQARACVEWAKP